MRGYEDAELGVGVLKVWVQFGEEVGGGGRGETWGRLRKKFVRIGMI